MEPITYTKAILFDSVDIQEYGSDLVDQSVSGFRQALRKLIAQLPTDFSGRFEFTLTARPNGCPPESALDRGINAVAERMEA